MPKEVSPSLQLPHPAPSTPNPTALGASAPSSANAGVDAALNAASDSVSRDQDFHRWLLDRASALRSRHFGFTDWNDVAEELEAMAKRDERELTSHLKNLLEHLLKWQLVPSHRGSSWEKTIKVSRDQIHDLLNDSPSLDPKLPDFVMTAYSRALRDAADEMKARGQDSSALPDSCPWPVDGLISEKFWPSGPDDTNSPDSP